MLDSAFVVVGSCACRAWSTRVHPRMAVNGVRSSCDTSKTQPGENLVVKFQARTRFIFGVPFDGSLVCRLFVRCAAEDGAPIGPGPFGTGAVPIVVEAGVPRPRACRLYLVAC